MEIDFIIRHFFNTFKYFKLKSMDEKLIQAEEAINQQIAKVDKILDKIGTSGQHFDDFLREEKAKLYGMLQIYWLVGGKGFEDFRVDHH